jgi:F420H(2)-dependent quinone reductase
MPVLLLTTKGRKSGKERTVPLGYLDAGDRYVVIGSKGGVAPEHPAWYLNLRADADVGVQIGSERRRMRARRASAEEEERLWPRVLAQGRGYEKYRQKTTREIPLVYLEPA